MIPQISKEEFEILDHWGRKRFGELWDRLNKRQKTLLVDDFFYKQYRKRGGSAKAGVQKQTSGKVKKDLELNR